MTGTPKPLKPRRNPWPIAIIAYFVVFISAMITWIVYASSQRMDLVGSDYYEREVLYQREIDASARARRAEGVKVAYDLAQQSITVSLPITHKTADATGTIRLYRPNNARLDREIGLVLGADGLQRLDASTLAPGLWKVRVAWRVNGEDYLFDQPLVVGGKS
jgi:nitrogen fixation protein FixH